MAKPDLEQAFEATGVERNWHRIAHVLVVSTLAYNVLEAMLALWAGINADSIAEVVHVCRERSVVPAGGSPAPAKVVPAG